MKGTTYSCRRRRDSRSQEDTCGHNKGCAFLSCFRFLVVLRGEMLSKITPGWRFGRIQTRQWQCHVFVRKSRQVLGFQVATYKKGSVTNALLQNYIPCKMSHQPIGMRQGSSPTYVMQPLIKGAANAPGSMLPSLVAIWEKNLEHSCMRYPHFLG